MNELLNKVLNLLDIKLEQEFYLKGWKDDVFRVTKYGTLEKRNIDKSFWEKSDVSLVDIICGKESILPFVPKLHESYWSFFKGENYDFIVISTTWKNTLIDYACLEAGWVFRTQEGAELVLQDVKAKYSSVSSNFCY